MASGFVLWVGTVGFQREWCLPVPGVGYFIDYEEVCSSRSFKYFILSRSLALCGMVPLERCYFM